MDGSQFMALHILDYQPPANADGSSVNEIDVLAVPVFDGRVAADTKNFCVLRCSA